MVLFFLSESNPLCWASIRFIEAVPSGVAFLHSVRGFESSSQPPGAAACTSPQTGTFLYPVPKRDGMQANPPHGRYSAFAPSGVAFLHSVRGFESTLQPPGAAACTSPQTGTFLYPVPKRDGMQTNPPHGRCSAPVPSGAAFLYPVWGFESASHQETSDPFFADRRFSLYLSTYWSSCQKSVPLTPLALAR